MKFNFGEFIYKILLFILLALLIIWSISLKMNCFLGYELMSEIPAWCWLLK